MTKPHKDEDDHFDLGDFNFDDISAMIVEDEEAEGANFPVDKTDDFKNKPAPAITGNLNDFVDENGLSDLPMFQVGAADDTSVFVEAFLIAVKDDYATTGVGSFDCVLQFRYGASMENLQRFIHAVQARVSRVRREASRRVAKFYVVADEKIVFAEAGFGVLRLKRMSAPIYEEWFSNRRSQQANKVSINNKLKDLL